MSAATTSRNRVQWPPGRIMTPVDNIWDRTLPLRGGAGMMPAMGFGTLIPDQAETRSATWIVQSATGMSNRWSGRFPVSRARGIRRPPQVGVSMRKAQPTAADGRGRMVCDKVGWGHSDNRRIGGHIPRRALRSGRWVAHGHAVTDPQELCGRREEDILPIGDLAPGPHPGSGGVTGHGRPTTAAQREFSSGLPNDRALTRGIHNGFGHLTQSLDIGNPLHLVEEPIQPAKVPTRHSDDACHGNLGPHPCRQHHVGGQTPIRERNRG